MIFTLLTSAIPLAWGSALLRKLRRGEPVRVRLARWSPVREVEPLWVAWAFAVALILIGVGVIVMVAAYELTFP